MNLTKNLNKTFVKNKMVADKCPNNPFVSRISEKPKHFYKMKRMPKLNKK